MKKFFYIGLSILICLLLVAISTSADEIYGGLTYSVNKGEVTITGADLLNPFTIQIPETIDGYPVTAIGDYAFQDYETLTSVTLPSGLKRIDSNFPHEKCGSNLENSIMDQVKNSWKR